MEMITHLPYRDITLTIKHDYRPWADGQYTQVANIELIEVSLYQDTKKTDILPLLSEETKNNLIERLMP